MTFQNMKASLFRYCDMSWAALTELKSWMKQSASFNEFDPQSFSATSLRVASATDESGLTVCYCPIETVFMVSAYAVNPSATEQQAQRAGDYIDARIDREAQLAGISKMLIVVPKDHPGLPADEYKEVRVYERRVPSRVMMGIGFDSSLPTAKFLN